MVPFVGRYLSMAWENENGMEFDPETGRIVNIVCYGEHPEQAIYSRRCNCGQFLKPELSAQINDCANEAFGQCSRCGRVRLNFICWSGDAA